MLIDAFAVDLFDRLDARARKLDAGRQLHVLVDGAFHPGLHRFIEDDDKALLFSLRPGCSDEAKAVSPFVTPYVPNCQRLKALLQRCSEWPMLSVIETSESFGELAARLAAWCVVDADSQRFNFRFADTRRLPGMYTVLNPEQRAGFAGPATSWLYVNRHGQWEAFECRGNGAEQMIDPQLDDRQFAQLVDDSKADELLVLLRDRGHDVFDTPSKSHALLSTALRAADREKLADDDVLAWCETFWKAGKLHDDTAAASLLAGWRTTSGSRS